MDLQTAFYIVGIVFMGVMFVLVLIILAAVLVIKAKINKVHDAVDNRLHQIKSVTDTVGLVLRTARHFAGR